MLELLFRGFFEWIYGLILECWEYFSSVLFDLMSLDFAYTLMAEPLFTGVLDNTNSDITITACNNAGFVLPFTGGMGFTTYFLFAALALMAGVYFCKKSDFMKEKTK